MNKPTNAPVTWVEHLCPVCRVSAWGDPGETMFCTRHPKRQRRNQPGKFETMRPIGAASVAWKKASA